MNGRGYSGHYRPARNRRRRISAAVISITLFLLLLVILFVFIGNILNGKTQGGSEPTKTDKPPVTDVKPAPASIVGMALDIEGSASSQLSNNISRIAQNGGKAISVNVRGSDSKLLYSSDVARHFGFQSGSGLSGIDTIVTRAQSRGLYVSAYIELESMSEKNPNVRAAMLGYEAALVGEMCASGVSDVMIYAPDTTFENYSELVRLAENVKAANPSAVIGVALKPSFFSEPNAAFVIDELFAVYDQIGMDLTSLSGEDKAAEISSSLSSQLYYILRYNMRVVLKSTEDKDLAESIDKALAENSVTNVQYVTVH